MEKEREFKTLLRRARQDRGVSLTEMAKRLDCAKSKIWSIEEGTAKLTEDIVMEYERVLNVSFSENGIQSLATQPYVQPAMDKTKEIADVVKPLWGFEFRSDVLHEHIKIARKRVWLLESWFGHSLAHMEQAFLASRAKDIRILLLHPESDLVGRRAADIYLSQEVVKEAILRNIKFFHGLRPYLKRSTFELRLFDVLPSVPLFICDQVALVGYYLHGLMARYGPWLEVQMLDGQHQATAFGVSLQQEFEKVWDVTPPLTGSLAKLC